MGCKGIRDFNSTEGSGYDTSRRREGNVARDTRGKWPCIDPAG